MSTAVSKLEQLLSQIQRRRNTQVTDEEDARPTNVPPAAAAPPSPAAVRAAPVPLMPSPPARVSAPPITSLPELNAFDFPEVTIQNLEVNDVLQEDNETLVEGSYRRSTRPGSPSSQTIAVMGPTQRIEPNLPGASPASTASPLTAQGQQRFGDILQKAFALRAKSS